ncbi:DUF2284 domain-containing protein [Eubacterium barkeri]|uniref:Predicted metal-binding protein n=1 Tax=Eubacterium barkeri TaxID=1528 RepID=A0A1H3DIV8_EUBBA|nr:DUF2284 domain-containing protein [Eubacterium barkeri]SDX66345.1 Predicted metal-binding protein [Eubacterium barkeri]
MAWLKYDPNASGGQYLEDLATAYWYSDTLFTALNLGLFDFLDRSPNATTADMAESLNLDEGALLRFLKLLKSLDLVDRYEGTWYNTQLSSDYLVVGRPLYQGGNIRWREELQGDWSTLRDVLAAGTRTHFPTATVSESEMEARRLDYLKAMDAVISLKIPEILPLLGEAIPPNARILDVGAGSGGFTTSLLAAYPQAQATLMDIRQILPHTRTLVETYPPDISRRIRYVDQNILEDPWQEAAHYDLIILSNIVHAYSEAEMALVLKNAAAHLAEDGLMLLHDFYTDHWEIKSRLSDINMLVNTYNGRAYDSTWVTQALKGLGLATTGLTPLDSDTSIVFASASRQTLDALSLDPVAQLIPVIRALGFTEAIPFVPRDVVVTDFAQNKCRFGCNSYDKKHCSRNHELSPGETQSLINTYTRALLLKGEPPTGDFQQQCLAAEAAAFKAGYYKAFIYWAGPCSICPNCDLSEPCTNHKHSRPSMEGSGIDVFATVSAVGETLKTLKEKGEVIKYYALLLLE